VTQQDLLYSKEMDMTSKTKSVPDQSSQLDAPITLTPDQIAEAVGGAALATVSDPIMYPPITMGLISPIILGKQLPPTVAL
jgi:hypothetical protein